MKTYRIMYGGWSLVKANNHEEAEEKVTDEMRLNDAYIEYIDEVEEEK